MRLERVAFYDPTSRRERYRSLTSFEAAFCTDRALCRRYNKPVKSPLRRLYETAP